MQVRSSNAQQALEVVDSELPVLEKFAADNVRKYDLEDRVFATVISGTDDLGEADVIMLSAVLHAVDSERIRKLMRRAFGALSARGRLLVVELMIDDERTENLNELLMSLSMLVATVSGFSFSAREVDVMAKDAGFVEMEKVSLAYPIDSIVPFK